MAYQRTHTVVSHLAAFTMVSDGQLIDRQFGTVDDVTAVGQVTVVFFVAVALQRRATSTLPVLTAHAAAVPRVYPAPVGHLGSIAGLPPGVLIVVCRVPYLGPLTLVVDVLGTFVRC